MVYNDWDRCFSLVCYDWGILELLSWGSQCSPLLQHLNLRDFKRPFSRNYIYVTFMSWEMPLTF